MKRVLYVTTVSRTINAFLIPHIKMLIDNGYEVHCASSLDKPIDDELIKKGVKFFEVPFSRNPLGIGNIKAFNKLKELQKINNYDIIHVHTPIAAIYGRLVKITFPKVKTIYTAHGYHFLKGGSKIGWLVYYPIEKIMAKFTDVTININNEDYEITKNKLKPKKCYLVNGVGLDLSKYKKVNEEEVNKVRTELGLSKDDFVILMIAEINKNKNHKQIIHAMELLKDKYESIKVLCVGEGSLEHEVKNDINSKYLHNRVFMLGYREDVTILINTCDIGVLMSYREGLPRNIMELMACGRKIIATNIRGCRDIVCNDYVGTLVEVGDYKATAEAIEKYYLLNDKSFSVSKEIEKYDVEAVNRQLAKIYDEISGEISVENGISYYVTNR